VITSIGSWGVAPSGKLVKIGPDKYGISFQWARSVQGGGFVGYVAVLAYVGGSFNTVLFIETVYYDYFPEENELKIKFVPGTNHDFYDIEIASQTYRFVGGAYQGRGEKATSKNFRECKKS
jgi:hypothetical protein